jgi:hypothetical protein
MIRWIVNSVAVACSLVTVVGCNQTTGGEKAALMANNPDTTAAQTPQKKIELVRCDAPIAAVALSTEQQAAMLAQYGLPSSALPAMRLVARQSNCFTIVNREVAQSGANFGAGRIMPAEYTIMVEVLVNKESGGAGSAGAAILAFIPYVGGIASAAASGVRTHSAQVLLTLIDNRSAVEVTSVTGKATSASVTLTGSGYGDAGGYDSSEQGKVVISAMVDAMNQLIPQVGPTTKRRM